MSLAAFGLAPIYVEWLLWGFAVTLLLSASACVAATLGGVLLCAARISPLAVLHVPARIYLGVFRNTPLLVQIFFWYFAGSAIFPTPLLDWFNNPHTVVLGFGGQTWLSFRLPSFEFWAGFTALTFYTTAFIAEEFRAGLRAVPAGQREGGLSLGLSPALVFFLVVVPQAARHAFAPLLGQYMNAVKNSSLTMAIGVAELSYASRQVETETFQTFEAFGIATVLYILAVAVIEGTGELVQRRREKKYGRGALS
ncbi:polar amino acid transport system permease protein [Pseudochelatococcus lubricantis]|uniref:Polar amino acid transport system permease protein n=1 Tax=Pseudochelatococcus lubricantis TaxID=1538102 RepID=A0ABX0UXD3_9HYPH|nr:amino acid ABC transporter permease [Pseudochelatococcus lubricantis]NIJ56520.1 polar amino acid transport system permease protein [Pseudochelatococcus lubricantis]